jgi:ribosomal protein S18 acetylase RimI-like enzyme
MSEIEYVEMICYLEGLNINNVMFPEGFEAQSLIDAKEDDLYRCYYLAFQAGDAQFFFDQNEDERREYFDTLGLDKARNEPGSVLILKDGAIVGFTYVLPYGEGNRHISCMCVLPEYQRQGFGTFMLRFALEKVANAGHKSITLGTDTAMGAFQLYRMNNFKVMEGG